MSWTKTGVPPWSGLSGRGSGADRSERRGGVLGRRWGGLLVVFTLAAGAACARYHPDPLPALAEAARPPRLHNTQWVREALAALENPLLGEGSVTLDDGLEPREVGLLAVVLNPSLRAARVARKEADAERLIARLLPNPEVGFDVSDPSGNGSAGLDPAYQLALSVSTRALLTRPARREAARERSREVDLRIAWQEWQVSQSARLAALRLLWLRRRIALASEELALQESTAAVLERAVETRDATLDQVGVQRAGLESVRSTVATLEQAEAESAATLDGLTGNVELPSLRLHPSDPRAQTSPLDIDRLLPVCLSHRVDLGVLRAAYLSQEARVREAVLEQIPDLRIGVTSSRDEASLKFLGGAVSLAVPAFDLNQGRIARETATRRRLAAEYRARALGVRTQVRRALGLIDAIDRQLPGMAASVEPLARIEQAERDAARRGDLDRLSYQTVRLALLEQRLGVAALSQARGEAVLALETECGRPIDGATGTIPFGGP